jgi:hypothetical protein
MFRLVIAIDAAAVRSREECAQLRFAPGRVVLGISKNPAGNRVGLVEMENGMPPGPGANELAP